VALRVEMCHGLRPNQSAASRHQNFHASRPLTKNATSRRARHRLPLRPCPFRRFSNCSYGNFHTIKFTANGGIYLNVEADPADPLNP
jgi:hypothetical protein